MEEQNVSQVRKPKKRGKKIKLALWVVAFILVLTGIVVYWHYRIYYPSTDDAYVQAHVVHIAPQVSGPIVKNHVINNQVVDEGELLFEIDSAPFIIAINAAKAKLDLARQKMKSLQNSIESAKALVVQRESEQEVTIKNARRTFELVKKGQASKADGDQATNRVQVSKAELKAARAQLEEVKEELGTIGDQNAAIRAAEARLNQAELDLKHTEVFAPSGGKIVNFGARVGTIVQAGRPLFDLVEQSEWWVNANFKETQLERVRPGQTASIVLDMYPSYSFSGKVESVSAGSGAAFSLLPPENATGNWVKVTQRIPVKVVIQDVSSDYPLRVGASAVVTVDTV